MCSFCHPSEPSGTFPGALPGHTYDVLLLEHMGNASLCALEQDTCTPLASFTSTVRCRDPHVLAVVAPIAQLAHPLPPLQGGGRPGLLEQELRRDVAAGQCRQVSAGSWWAAGRDRAGCDVFPSSSPQVWHPENSTGVMLWACSLNKCECPGCAWGTMWAWGRTPTLSGCQGPPVGADPCPADLHAHWVLAWMGVLLGAACILLLLLLKKEDLKGERCLPWGLCLTQDTPRTPSHRLSSLQIG